MDAETLPIRDAGKAPRKNASKPKVKASDMDDRITLNLTISRRARMILGAHTNLYRGTPRSTASGLVESLILAHLKDVKVSDYRGQADPSAESA
jgi:hypothetical protein